jgi:hypothetical protein
MSSSSSPFSSSKWECEKEEPTFIWALNDSSSTLYCQAIE